MSYVSASARLAAAAGGAVPLAGPAFPIGFAPGAGTPTNAEVDDMVGRWNAKVLRCGISWDAMSSGINGVFDQTNGADNFVEYCCSKGIGVIFQVGSGPTNNGKMYVPATIIKHAQFCRAVMARYNGTKFSDGNFVLAVSVGNEPNHAKYDDGVASGVSDDEKGHAYAELMIRIASPFFNNARGIPNCPPIQIGGLGGESFRVGIPSSMFTEQAYESITVGGHVFPQGWKTAYDIFDQHPYSYPVLASRDQSDGWWQMVNVIRPIMVSNGDSAKRICISEIGFPTNPNTPAEYEKAKLGLIDAVNEATSLGYIDSFCWFSYMNNNKPPGPGVGNDNYFGIVLNNATPSAAVPKTGTTTPGYAATFANLAGTGTPPPPPPPPPPARRLPKVLGLCAAATTQFAANVGARPAGVTLKRIDFDWWTIQPTNPGNKPAGQNDTFNWTTPDAIWAAAQANGYDLIAMCGYTPPWAGGDGITGHGYPRGNYSDYANFVRAVAQRYPGIIIEYWNEPNQSDFLAPVSIANFAKLCRAGQDAIKSGIVVGRANRQGFPNTITIAGGTGAAPAVGNQFRHLNWTRSLAQLDKYCADHFGIHAYPGGCVLGTHNGYDPGWNDVLQIRAFLDSIGRTDAQIPCTEAGYFTRLDSTPTNTNDSANCNHYGSGPGDQKKQVTVSMAATLLPLTLDWWFANVDAPFLYYEQDNNQAGDLFNSGGLYYNPSNNYNGAAKTSTGGDPVLLDAFLAYLGGNDDTTDPTALITYPNADSPPPLSGDFTILGLVSDDVSPLAGIVAKLYKDDGATFVATMNPSPGGVPLGFNEVYNGTPQGWPDGTYQLRVKATDEAGNVGTSARRTITIANGSALPRVDSVVPNHGPLAGGTPVTVTGDGFTGATAVKIAGVDCTDLAVGAAVQHIFPFPPLSLASQAPVADDTILTCTTPAGFSAGVRNLRVTTPAGQSPISANAKFTYDDDTPPPPGAPTLTLLEPETVALAGGDTVLATGTNCGDVSDVTVDDVPATDVGVSAQTATTVSFVTPPGSAPGQVDVRLENPAGVSAVVPEGVLTYRSAAPEGTFTAVQLLPDGSVITDLSQPIHVPNTGTLRIFVEATDDVDSTIPETWVALGSNRLADGTPAPDDTYYYDLDLSLLPIGAVSLEGHFRDSEQNEGVTA